MPFVPRSEQSRSDKTDSPILVVFLSQRRDEILQCFAEAWIVVFGCMDFLGRKRGRIVIQPRGHLQTVLDQKLWNAVVMSRINHPDSKNGLMSA